MFSNEPPARTTKLLPILFNLAKHLWCFHAHPYAFAVAGKLRRIHTLNGGNSIAEITGMRYKHRVFENVSTPGQPAKKEIGAGIFGAFVIA